MDIINASLFPGLDGAQRIRNPDGIAVIIFLVTPIIDQFISAELAAVLVAAISGGKLPLARRN
ncbi:MAG TPA: hypothetical protein VF445_08225 [Bordetella sp.]|uniref:hypothetical protein n=1 Tax=Bordetella sp. TaxID=28081 RepID=UPI002ED5238E